MTFQLLSFAISSNVIAELTWIFFYLIFIILIFFVALCFSSVWHLKKQLSKEVCFILPLKIFRSQIYVITQCHLLRSHSQTKEILVNSCTKSSELYHDMINASKAKKTHMNLTHQRWNGRHSLHQIVAERLELAHNLSFSLQTKAKNECTETPFLKLFVSGCL